MLIIFLIVLGIGCFLFIMCFEYMVYCSAREVNNDKIISNKYSENISSKKSLLLPILSVLVCVIIIYVYFFYINSLNGTWVRNGDNDAMVGMTVDSDSGQGILTKVNNYAMSYGFKNGDVKWNYIKKTGINTYSFSDLRKTTNTAQYVTGKITILFNKAYIVYDNNYIGQGTTQLWERKNILGVLNVL